MAAKKKTLLKPKKKTVRRPTVLKSEPSQPIPKDNVSEHGTLKLTDTQRLTLNWEGAELRSANSVLKLKNAEYEALLRKLDPQGILRKAQSELSSASEATKIQEAKFIASCREVGAKLGLNTSQRWSYDDVTGIVHVDDPASS